MSKFQIIIIAFFSFSAVIGVALFATFSSGNNEPSVEVLVWGTMPEADFLSWYTKIPTSKDNRVRINYESKREETFDEEFVEALADGRGPDVIFLPHDKIVEHQNRIYKIPYTTLSERQFRDLFIEEAELYLASDGIFALPLMVDPLVMYWNRDIFRNAGIPSLPQYWDEFPDTSLTLTEKDAAGNITQSAVALGEFSNIHRAREIISILLMQAGTPITDTTREGVRAVLTGNYGSATSPADAALTFYTQFANPAKDINSWNRSFPNSLIAFSSGDLALFFGLSSDLFRIQARNPNLNFDVAQLPQPRSTPARMTYGTIEGLALVRQSRDIPGAYRAIQILTSAESVRLLVDTLKIPPVRRDVLAQKPTDAYMSVFYDSALISRAWLSPEPMETDQIFRTMIEAITSGRLRMNEAIQMAQNDLEQALK